MRKKDFFEEKVRKKFQAVYFGIEFYILFILSYSKTTDILAIVFIPYGYRSAYSTSI